MGMALGLEKNNCSQQDLQKALRLVPKALEPYVLGKTKTLLRLIRYVFG